MTATNTTTVTTTTLDGEEVTASPFTTDAAFWASDPWLEQLHDYAVDRMLAPMAVLQTVIMRAAATLPPDVGVQSPLDGKVSPLNVFVAACGVSGSGKGRTYAAARDIIPDLRHGTAETAGVTSGEGMAAQFASMQPEVDEHGKPDRTQPPRVHVHTVYQLINATEIAGLAATASRNGSTALDRLLRAWTGESLSTHNKGDADRLRVPERAYRLCAYLGVQPASAALLSDSIGAGLAQRFLYARVAPSRAEISPMAPTSPTPPPVVNLVHAIGEPPMTAWERVYAVDDWSGISHRRIHMPTAVTTRLWALRYADDTLDDAGDLLSAARPALDSHRLLLTMRVAAVLACILAGGLPRGMVVPDDVWGMACHIVADSCAVREALFRAYASTCSAREATRLITNGVARDDAEATLLDRRVHQCKRAVIKRLWAALVARGSETTPEAIEASGDGVCTVTGATLRHGVAYRLRGTWATAMTDLLADGIVTVVGDATPGTPLERLDFAVVTDRVPDDLRPAGAR